MSLRLILLFALPLSALAKDGGPNSIRDARAAAAGTVVTVTGTVTTPSGAYDPNDLGFAIQSGNAGLYIHDALGQSLAVGQTVSVTGAVGDSFGEVWGVYPASITVTGTHSVPSPRKVDTGEVNESTEGRLVNVEGVVTDAVFDDAPYGWRFHIDDGSGELTVFVYTGTGIDLSGIGPGDVLEITGFSGQFIDHYELNPRFAADIEVEDD